MAESSSAQLDGSANLVFPPEKFEDEVSDEASGLMEKGQDPRIGSNNEEIVGHGRTNNIHCVGWITLNLLVGIIASAIVLSLYWEGHYNKAFPVAPATRAPKAPTSADAIPFVGSTPNQPFEAALPNTVTSETQAPTSEETHSIDVGDDELTLEEPLALANEEEVAPVPETEPPVLETEPPVPEAEPVVTEPPVPVTEPPVPVTKPPVPVTEPPVEIALSEAVIAESPADHSQALTAGTEVGLDAYEYQHTAIAQNQIQNFLNYGRAVLLNVVINHHGGTTVRREYSEFLPCPSFACLHPHGEDNVHDNYPDYSPWAYNDTAKNLGIVRGVPFRFLTWQFGAPPPLGTSTQIADTNWEDPNLVSMLVIREPISRALAGDGLMSQKHPNIFTTDPNVVATKEEWWNFAYEETHNNNFALRILSDSNCCQGAETPREYLEKAKELVKRFTFVLDINCLEHGLVKLADTLGFEPQRFEDLADYNHHHNPAKDKIPHPDVYEYLVEKNKLDIELYEWAKTRALLNCDAVYAAEALAAAQQQEEEAAAAAMDNAALLSP